MGNTCGQKTDAGKLFAADHLFGAKLDLTVEVVADFPEPGCHIVERGSQFSDLILCIDLNPMAEVSGGNPP